MSIAPARQTLSLNSIDVVRAPGIPRGFVLAHLKPGVNVIYGPNASGKSTTARAIHSLFWPDRDDDGLHVSASLSHLDSQWTVTRNGRMASANRDGVSAPTLTFSHLSKETRNRYLLALHDLLRDTDSSFAAMIATEMSGGFNVEDAATSTGFEKQSTASRQRNDLNAALSAHANLLASQATIVQERNELDELSAKQESIADAQRSADRLKRIRHALDLRDELDNADLVLAQFPEEVAAANANDLADINKWVSDENALLVRLYTATSDRDKLEHQGTQLQLPELSTARTLLAELTEHLESVKSSDAALRKVNSDLASARLVAARRNAEIGPHLPEELRLGDTVALLNQLALAVDRATEAKETNAALALVGNYIERPGPFLESYPVRRRLELLVSWLQAPAPMEPPPALRSIRIAAFLAALIIIVEAALLGYFWSEYAYGIAVIGVAVVLFAALSKNPPVDDMRHQIEQTWVNELDGDEINWNAEVVTRELVSTIAELTSIEDLRRRTEIWKSIEIQIAERASTLASAESDVANLEQEFDIAFTPERNAMRQISNALDQALTASRAVVDLESALTVAAEAFDADLQVFNETSAALTDAKADDVASASAAFSQIAGRINQLDSIDRQLETNRQSLESIETERQRIDASRNALMERYGGLPLDEIVRFAERFEAYREAKTIRLTRDDQFHVAESALGDDVDLDQYTRDELDAEIERQESIMNSAASVNQRIGAIETRIDAAMNSEQVAASLRKVEAAKEALVERRDSILRNQVGALLIAEVRSQSRNTNLPVVAHRARELFAAFTHGRYQLQMGSGRSPRFTAHDTQLGEEQSLEQLSSATRVQLLIAVRMAFVEQQEGEVRLPLIFDETLANADDFRADALVDTTLQIAASGRQVFYFTAQIDEVSKWKSHAESEGVDISIIDLAVARGDAERALPPVLTMPQREIQKLVDPEGHDRVTYRAALAVPQLDPWNGGIDAAHLWYLIEDNAELYRLNAEYRLDRWGQVSLLAHNGDASLIGIDPDRFSVLCARAHALEALIDAAMVGHGRPVTNEALQASGGMGGKFDADCRSLLSKVGNDGARFVSALRGRRIAGFRTDKVDQFEDYFERNGYIVASQQLSVDEIRARIASSCSDEMDLGVLDLATIDRMMAEAFSPTIQADLPHEKAPRLPIGE